MRYNTPMEMDGRKMKNPWIVNAQDKPTRNEPLDKDNSRTKTILNVNKYWKIYVPLYTHSTSIVDLCACSFFRNEIQSVQRLSQSLAISSLFLFIGMWMVLRIGFLYIHCDTSIVVCFHVVFAPQTIAKMPILCKCSRREANFVQLRRIRVCMPP